MSGPDESHNIFCEVVPNCLFVGLTSFGILGKHILKAFRPWKDIKVRLVSSFICNGFTVVIDHSFFCL